MGLVCNECMPDTAGVDPPFDTLAGSRSSRQGGWASRRGRARVKAVSDPDCGNICRDSVTVGMGCMGVHVVEL